MVLVVVLAVGLATVFAAAGRGPDRKHKPASTTTSVPRHRIVTAARCPLTDEPAPGGKVPRRPAIGVKIGNDPASRPQSGLQDADIVYEEMAEGGITRYLAIYQCKQAPVVGPVRSVRWDDWHVLASYGHPILAFSGGIQPWNEVVASLKWLYDANGTFYPQANAYYRTSNRVPPWNLYTSTKALWKLDPKEHTPPPRQFRYSSRPPSGSTPAKGVTIVGFAAGQNVVWQWRASAHAWERLYGTQPDVDASGAQLHATNVVIQVVETRPGPYAESGTIPDVESLTAGSGVAYVFRNGRVERGTWSTPAYRDPMKLRFPDGKPMKLDPGNTWVEVVPVGYAVQVRK